MEKKKIGVLFSGGLDSTYLVWKILSDGNCVIPFYFEIENNGQKPLLERNRIELLRKKFNEEFDNRVENINYNLKVSVINQADGLHFAQVPIWLLSLIFSQRSDIEEIQIGYVMNDDAISYIDDIKNIYESYSAILNKQIPLNFPLVKYKKDQLLHDLPSKYRELIISCENPHVITDIIPTKRNSLISKVERDLRDEWLRENVDKVKFEYEPCGDCAACSRIMHERHPYDLPEYYKQKLYNRCLNDLRYVSKDVKEREEDNRFYYMIEVKEPQTFSKMKPEPYQLEINFNQEFDAVIELISKSE